MKKIRLGAGSAYWGDLLEPAVELADKGELDYLCFDHLSELTLAVLQRQKAKDPNEGYIKDIEPWLEATLPQARKLGFKIVTNAGGANPAAAAQKVIEVAQRLGLGKLKIAVVTGDDIFPDLDEIRSLGIRLPTWTLASPTSIESARTSSRPTPMSAVSTSRAAWPRAPMSSYAGASRAPRSSSAR